MVATGLGATGLTVGPYAGQIAARLTLREPPGLDLAPFDPLRARPASTRTRAARRPGKPRLARQRPEHDVHPDPAVVGMVERLRRRADDLEAQRLV